MFIAKAKLPPWINKRTRKPLRKTEYPSKPGQAKTSKRMITYCQRSDCKNKTAYHRSAGAACIYRRHLSDTKIHGIVAYHAFPRCADHCFLACTPLSKIRTCLYRKDARRLKKLGIQFICIPAVAVVSETIALWQGAKSIEIISNFGNVTTSHVLILVSLVSATIQRRSIVQGSAKQIAPMNSLGMQI